MSISRQEFNQQSIKFYQSSIDLDDHWDLVALDSRNVPKTVNRQRPHVEDITAQLMLSKSDMKLVEAEGDSRVATIEYTVIYNESYEVPVMYFSVSHTDGSVYDVKRALKILSCHDDTSIRKIISQVEHPLLSSPYFLVHPCRTEHLMRNHNNLNRDKYLICWLSTVGTLVGLKLDYRFGLDGVKA